MDRPTAPCEFLRCLSASFADCAPRCLRRLLSLGPLRPISLRSRFDASHVYEVRDGARSRPGSSSGWRTTNGLLRLDGGPVERAITVCQGNRVQSCARDRQHPALLRRVPRGLPSGTSSKTGGSLSSQSFAPSHPSSWPACRLTHPLVNFTTKKHKKMLTGILLGVSILSAQNQAPAHAGHRQLASVTTCCACCSCCPACCGQAKAADTKANKGQCCDMGCCAGGCCGKG